MPWHNCIKNPPEKPGTYWILWLSKDFEEGDEWIPAVGLYYGENSRVNPPWRVADIHNELMEIHSNVGYWMPIESFPPVPLRKDVPICEYYQRSMHEEFGETGYCMAQKNMPRCYCQGNQINCEK